MLRQLRKIALVIAASVAFGLGPTVNAETTAQTKEQLKEALKEINKETEAAKEEPGGERDKAILQNNFGAGLFANFDSKKRVKSARVAGGIVRVEEDSSAQLGFLIEAHRFISDPPDGLRRKVHGPFVGVVATGENLLDAAVLGYMWGWRKTGSTETLNLGLGFSVTPRAKILGDGIEEGKPLPNGETEVRFKEKTLYGVAITVSFGF